VNVRTAPTGKNDRARVDVTRERRSLNGVWGFQLDPGADITLDSLRPDRRIPVPMPWQAAFPELRRYSGYAWYEHRFAVSAAWLGTDVRVRFGAVDYWCEAFVNGERVGEHEGGYTPFEFAVGRLLRAGENRLVMRVFDAAQSQMATERWPDFGAQMVAAANGPPFVAQHIPHGKQEVYVNVGGIWQDVWLVHVPDVAIDRLAVTPHLASGTVLVDARMAGDLAQLPGGRLEIAVTADGADVAHAAVPLSSGAERVSTRIRIDDPHPWSVEDPFLYRLRARIHGEAGDPSAETRFGMRSFSFRDGVFLLNERPIYLLAVLDQDLYPGTIYTLPSEAFLVDQFRKVKELGFNTLRCHIKVPDPRYLDLADEMGLLVWTEIPSWRTFWMKGAVHAGQLEIPAEVRARVEHTLDEMVARDHDHPSLVLRTLVNEDWGTSLPLSTEDRRWVRALYERSKQLDPTRLVVDNSACSAPWGPNFHIRSDVDDFHIYAGIPDQASAFSRAVGELALRPLWTFSTHGDAERRGDEPLVLSEFGNWGLPSLRSLRGSDGEDPDWLTVGPWGSGWDVEPGWPAGAVDRFGRLGLDRIWADYETFAVATQRHQYEALKFEIETLRRQPSLGGYVVTQLSDTFWESNGLLDFHRGRKAHHDDYRRINAMDVVVGVPRRRSYWSGEQVEADVRLSHFSGRASGGTVLEWEIGDPPEGGKVTLTTGSPPETVRVGTLRFHAPTVARTTVFPIRFTVRDRSDQEIAGNTTAVVIYPRTMLEGPGRGALTVLDDAAEMDIARQDFDVPAERETPAVAQLQLQTEPVGAQWESAGVPSLLRRRSGASLAAQLGRLGYSITTELDHAGIAVATSASAGLLRWVRAGGQLLFLADMSSPFFWLQPRVGTYGGGWITSFSWLRPGTHPRLLESNPLGLEFLDLMPVQTIVGIPMEDRAISDDILAGMVVGWVHHPTAHTIRFRYGAGKVVMTTFPLAGRIGTHPTVTAMILDLLDELGSVTVPVLSGNY
jgi:hypothetical protein